MFDEFMEGIKQENTEEIDKVKEELEQIFKNQMTEIEKWFTEINLDITKLKGFDFDNLAELKGTTKHTNFLENGNIEEKIFITADNTQVATRITNFLENSDIEENIKVYERNGIDIVREITIITKFNEDGSISEAIS